MSNVSPRYQEQTKDYLFDENDWNRTLEPKNPELTLARLGQDGNALLLRVEVEHVPVENGQRREGRVGGLLDEDVTGVEHRRHNHLGGHRLGERELKKEENVTNQ